MPARSGRLAATVFRAAAASPWLPAALLGAAPHLGPLPRLPIGDEPGPFAFADPARPRKALTAAGFTDIGVRPVDTVLRAPDNPDKLAGCTPQVVDAGCPHQRDGDSRCSGEAGECEDRAWSGVLSYYSTSRGTGWRCPGWRCPG